MADPVWVDANLVIDASRGNPSAIAELKARAARGHKLLITPKANQEILYGNPVIKEGSKPINEATRTRIQQTLQEFKIEVDMAGGSRPLSERLTGNGRVSTSDDMVLGQVKAGGNARGIAEPVLLTGEGASQGIVARAGDYGVRVERVTVNGAPATVPAEVPAVTGVRTPPRIGTNGIRPRLAMTFRFVGGLFVDVAISLFLGWVQKKLDESSVRRQLKEDEPKIQAKINEQIPSIADLQARGKKAYANVVVDIVTTIHCFQNVCSQSSPAVVFQNMWISADNINGEGTPKIMTGGAEGRAVPFMFSLEVSVPAETVKVWRDFMEEWDWYEKEKKKYTGQAYLNLSEQQEVLHKEIIAVFGEKPTDNVLNAWMWPKFKFKTKG